MIPVKKPKFVVEEGKRVAVILDIAEYEQMIELLEEVEDLAMLQEIRKKPLQFRPLSEFLDEYHPSV